jgi:hypothetical protein
MGAKRQGADLREAELQGAHLTGADLREADVGMAHLPGAYLGGAQLHGADLWAADLQGADLSGSHLQGALLTLAELRGANLRNAQLQGAMLGRVSLQGADLSDAQLQGAILREAELQGVDLSRAQLQGAALRVTKIWRARLNSALWYLADLRGSTAQPMTDPAIDDMITWITNGIPNQRLKASVAARLNKGLRSKDRPAGPDFPEEWRSAPNVMFEAGDPEPEPFDWGPERWGTEQAYDDVLANFLGDLACGPYIPEAQTLGLARRALATARAEDGWSDRVWPRLFAVRLLRADCPPAKGVPDDMRNGLEELLARGDATAALPEMSRPDPVE